jgi:hypothetical protein
MFHRNDGMLWQLCTEFGYRNHQLQKPLDIRIWTFGLIPELRLAILSHIQNVWLLQVFFRHALIEI